MSASRPDLEVRVARTETLNRLLSCAFAGMLVLIMLAGAGRMPGAIAATSFQLVDTEGRVRGELSMGADGPMLTLKDEAGRDRLTISQEDDGTGMYIADAEGTTRIGVAQFVHGGGGVALHGPESKGAAVLYLKGEGSLRFFDATGKVTSQIPSPEGKE